jgi:hypothetical protein
MDKVEKEIMQAYKMFFNAFDDKDRFIPTDERLKEYTDVVNSHLSKFFNSVKKDIISNYEKIKKDVLDDNLLKQIEYEAPVKKRGRPKKISNTEEIKVTVIPKTISGKNEIKNILNDIKEEIKTIKKDDKKDNKENKTIKKDKIIKEEKKDAPLVINRKGKTYYIEDSDDLNSIF